MSINSDWLAKVAICPYMFQQLLRKHAVLEDKGFLSLRLNFLAGNYFVGLCSKA